jgi:hypothetical protein
MSDHGPYSDSIAIVDPSKSRGRKNSSKVEYSKNSKLHRQVSLED